MSRASSVIHQCVAKGIREYVLCAGARNLSFVNILSQIEDVFVWNHFEERSSGFFALGRTMDSAEPCAVVTTSGTAVAELLPAVIEAYYQNRPLVIISADRPSSYRGTGAPQSIEQVGIFGQYAKTVDGTENILDSWSGLQPWHINVSLDEEIEEAKGDFIVKKYKPESDSINVSKLAHFLQDVWSGLVVALGGLEPEDREEVFHFLNDLKVPVIADSTSGLREALGKLVVAKPEQMMKSSMTGKVLRIGDIPVGRFWRDLEDDLSVEVLSLTRTGFSGLARESKVLKGNITRMLKGLGKVDVIGDVLDVFGQNSRDVAKIDELLEAYPDSEPGMVRVISQYASMASTLYLGNSLPIREWNQFAQRDIPIEFVRANRGANGIDGQLSTWLGNTVGVDDSWCVIGDLTTLYDFSALSWLDQVGGARRVLVIINNGGGRIFERLPRVRGLDEGVQDVVSNTHHFSFELWAEMWGMDYLCCESSDDVDVEAPENGIVVELRPSAGQTQEFWGKIE